MMMMTGYGWDLWC